MGPDNPMHDRGGSWWGIQQEERMNMARGQDDMMMDFLLWGLMPMTPPKVTRSAKPTRSDGVMDGQVPRVPIYP